MELNSRTFGLDRRQRPELIPVARQPTVPVNFTVELWRPCRDPVGCALLLNNDKWTSGQIPLSRLWGSCQVLDLTHVARSIEVEYLKKLDIRREDFSKD